MARIRTIKPGFWKHEELSALPEATHILAAALLNYADDYGYFNAHTGLIRAECSPLREPSVSIPESLQSLKRIGYLRLGMGADGKRYGQIVKFDEHQRVSHASESKIAKISIAWDGSGIPPEPIAKAPEPLRPEGNKEEEGNKEREWEGETRASAREALAPPTASPSAEPEEPDLLPLSMDRTDCGQAVRAYNALADRAGLPQVQKLTAARRRALRSRLADCGGIAGWSSALEKLEASSFCRGKNDRSWVADFDFLVRESSFVKLMEGKYDDRDGGPSGPFNNGFAELAASGGV